MTDEKKTTMPEAKEEKKKNKKGFFPKRKFSHKEGRPESEFEQTIIDIARVTRVMAGGKRMRFRACVAVGNKKGKIGIGLAKGADVATAISKGANQARKNMIDVQLANKTIPHAVTQKYGAGLILLKPAQAGRGIICGGVVRLIVELAGIHNITGKILGTNNKVTNAKTVIKALQSLKQVKQKKSKEEKKSQLK
ncbi:MAG: 30S ribosomal protein S5 [bacterium]